MNYIGYNPTTGLHFVFYATGQVNEVEYALLPPKMKQQAEAAVAAYEEESQHVRRFSDWVDPVENIRTMRVLAEGINPTNHPRGQWAMVVAKIAQA